MLQAESLPGAIGITADDVVAGLYGLAIGHLAAATFLWGLVSSSNAAVDRLCCALEVIMEWHPKAVVVGVDGSETSRTAAEHARRHRPTLEGQALPGHGGQTA